ncbi:MAG: isoprenylcysteine carboxylmethyltransferase family protein [Proteobacteria bacterium]|nr:isoprenylcysteine carboxylmethyltransferase family protein [Pseudomonadota bacterium]
MSKEKLELYRNIGRRTLTATSSIGLLGVLLFVSAGRLDWMRAWFYLGLTMTGMLINFVVLVSTNPEVIAARGKNQVVGTKWFDKVFVMISLPLGVAIFVVAGLESGRWGGDLGPIVAGVGILMLCLANIPILSSLVVNRHLEKTVRIQSERDHQVVTAGPYQWVRHPMYVGMILQQFGCPLLLGSRWALIPAALASLAFVVRTALEDQTLQDELPGYTEFTQQTKYRLFPGIW